MSDGEVPVRVRHLHSGRIVEATLRAHNGRILFYSLPPGEALAWEPEDFDDWDLKWDAVRQVALKQRDQMANGSPGQRHERPSS